MGALRPARELRGIRNVRAATLTNRGDSPLLVSRVSVAGDALSVNDTCQDATIAPGGSCFVSVRFTPTIVTTLATTLRIDSNAMRGPLLLAISGSGVVPFVAMRAEPLSFGGQPMGSYAERPFVVTNTGSDYLIVSDVRVVGPSEAFTLTAEDCLRQPLAPGAACTITVRFKPSRAADESASLIVRGNMPSGAAVYSLTGSGLPEVSLSVQSAGPRAAALSAAASLCLWVTLLAETSYVSLVCLLAALYLRKRRVRLNPEVALIGAAPRVTKRLTSPIESSATV